MNLQEALDTAEWLLKRAQLVEFNDQEVFRIRKMRDVLYYLHTAAGIAEIRLDAFEQGQATEYGEHLQPPNLDDDDNGHEVRG